MQNFTRNANFYFSAEIRIDFYKKISRVRLRPYIIIYGMLTYALIDNLYFYDEFNDHISIMPLQYIDI